MKMIHLFEYFHTDFEHDLIIYDNSIATFDI
jgi:hypothetical protein